MIKLRSGEIPSNMPERKMNVDKKNAVLVGVFILVAYGVLVNTLTESIILVMLADVISGLAVMGIAILLYPYFKNISSMIPPAYLSLKMIEGGLMILGGLIFLNTSLHAFRSVIYDDIHIWIFIVSGFLLYYLFYQSKIIPKFISIWGFIAIFTLLIRTSLYSIDISYPLLDYLLLLIISNEVFLAIWLMIKGFNLSKIENMKKSNDIIG